MLWLDPPHVQPQVWRVTVDHGGDGNAQTPPKRERKKPQKSWKQSKAQIFGHWYYWSQCMEKSSRSSGFCTMLMCRIPTISKCRDNTLTRSSTTSIFSCCSPRLIFPRAYSYSWTKEKDMRIIIWEEKTTTTISARDLVPVFKIVSI